MIFETIRNIFFHCIKLMEGYSLSTVRKDQCAKTFFFLHRFKSLILIGNILPVFDETIHLRSRSDESWLSNWDSEGIRVGPWTGEGYPQGAISLGDVGWSLGKSWTLKGRRPDTNSVNVCSSRFVVKVWPLAVWNHLCLICGSKW